MADKMHTGVAMYDIRSDKSGASLVDMIKQGLASKPKSMPTLLLYNGAHAQRRYQRVLLIII